MGLDLYVQKRKRSKGKETETLELAYFRKVNFLIPWFERWFDEEIGNCIPISINKDSCIALVEACEEVLEHHEKAPEQLPTQHGFFYGSTDYDEYYFTDVQNVATSFKDDVIPEFDSLEDDEDIIFEIWY